MRFQGEQYPDLDRACRTYPCSVVSPIGSQCLPGRRGSVAGLSWPPRKQGLMLVHCEPENVTSTEMPNTMIATSIHTQATTVGYTLGCTWTICEHWWDYVTGLCARRRVVWLRRPPIRVIPLCFAVHMANPCCWEGARGYKSCELDPPKSSGREI